VCSTILLQSVCILPPIMNEIPIKISWSSQQNMAYDEDLPSLAHPLPQDLLSTWPKKLNGYSISLLVNPHPQFSSVRSSLLYFRRIGTHGFTNSYLLAGFSNPRDPICQSTLTSFRFVGTSVLSRPRYSRCQTLGFPTLDS
jgi:hypothetical protein